MSKIPGVNVLGFIDGEFGLGESVRSTLRSLESQGIPVAINNLNIEIAQRRRDTSYREFSADNPHPINIVQLNGDRIHELEEAFKGEYLKGKYNIGYWAWELQDFPDNWRSALYAFDEIWALSSYCADGFARVSPVPVLAMPLSIESRESNVSRAQLKLPEDKFIFLFTFDYGSVYERKNPIGLIRAFKEAFGDNDRVLLFIKSINGNLLVKEGIERVREEIGDAQNIRGVDGVWDRADVMGLMANCDAYVSLHRSEGFGYTIAEAMSFAKPVIATAWSSNTEFMNLNNSFPVRYRLVEMERDYPPYRKGSVWADPDVSHAAELMRYVFDNRDEAAKIGARAAADIKETLAPDVIGRRMKDRLEYITFLNGDFPAPREDGGQGARPVSRDVEIVKLEGKIGHLEETIDVMKQSFFWKLRDRWWKLKRFWNYRD
jgi:glycosyltransferase involved in cell wall biosynthesis